MDRETSATLQWDGTEVTSNMDDVDTILLKIQEKAAMVGVAISISELRRITQIVDVGRLDTEKMQAIIDQMIEISQQVQRKRHIRANRSLKEQLDSYAIASLAQRMAMVSGASTLAYKRIQARKLIKRYNRR